MDSLLTILHSALSFAVIIGIIVIIHEGGHFLVARLCGVKVEVFSIGFGREIAGFNDRRGTRWKLSALPLGGYVKMFGDAGAASNADHDKLGAMTQEERNVSFHYKPLWRKALIVVAGPVANFILTIAVFTYLIYAVGISSTKPIVGEVLPNTPAASAGLEKDDIILKVDNRKIRYFNDIIDSITYNTGTPVVITFERHGEQLQKTLTPTHFDDKDALNNDYKRPMLGIRSVRMTYENVSFPQAIALSIEKTYDLCEGSLRAMGQMISGDRSTRELKGTLGIAKLSGDVTRQGKTFSETFHMVLWFIALISANLGMVNLFPIPMLDGGHLAFYCIEAVRGRPLADKFQEYSLRFGVAVIACLMAFTLFNDVRNMLGAS